MARILEKGDSIFVAGALTPRRWKKKADGTDGFGLSIAVERWFLNPARIEEIQILEARGNQAADEGGGSDGDSSGDSSESPATYTTPDITQAGAASAAGNGHALAADDHPGAGVEPSASTAQA